MHKEGGTVYFFGDIKEFPDIKLHIPKKSLIKSI